MHNLAQLIPRTIIFTRWNSWVLWNPICVANLAFRRSLRSKNVFCFNRWTFLGFLGLLKSSQAISLDTHSQVSNRNRVATLIRSSLRGKHLVLVQMLWVCLPLFVVLFFFIVLTFRNKCHESVNFGLCLLPRIYNLLLKLAFFRDFWILDGICLSIVRASTAVKSRVHLFKRCWMTRFGRVLSILDRVLAL